MCENDNKTIEWIYFMAMCSVLKYFFSHFSCSDKDKKKCNLYSFSWYSYKRKCTLNKRGSDRWTNTHFEFPDCIMDYCNNVFLKFLSSRSFVYTLHRNVIFWFDSKTFFFSRDGIGIDHLNNFLLNINSVFLCWFTSRWGTLVEIFYFFNLTW